MKFEEIMPELRKRKKARNEAWNGLRNKEMYVRIQFPDRDSVMTEPYLVMHVGDKIVPWFPSNLDLFCNRWVIFEPSY